MRRIKLIIYVLSIKIAGMLLLGPVFSNGYEESKKEPWKGKLKDGAEISKDDLSKIIVGHKIWHVTGEQKDNMPMWVEHSSYGQSA